jgi:CelD/BcsL family acetyltransferase involved in cellulose biosynthesis
MNSQAHSGIEIHIERLPGLEDLGAQWMCLDQIGRHSFFQSWGWIGPWLRTAPKQLDVTLVRAVRGKTTVGLAVLTQRSKKLYGFIPVRQGWLNASGDPQFDRLAVEHNGFATAEPEPHVLESAFVALLLNGDLHVDELVLPCMASLWPATGPVLARKRQELGFRCSLTAGGAEPLSVGSRNTRQQLKRAMRKCEAYGRLELRRAEGQAEKLSYFSQMKELHRNSWQRRNRTDAFDNPHFELFCHELLKDDGADGVDLLRLQAGPKLLGVLLNFRRLGIIYNYQS